MDGSHIAPTCWRPGPRAWRWDRKFDKSVYTPGTVCGLGRIPQLPSLSSLLFYSETVLARYEDRRGESGALQRIGISIRYRADAQRARAPSRRATGVAECMLRTGTWWACGHLSAESPFSLRHTGPSARTS